jgi:hypothetical protein
MHLGLIDGLFVPHNLISAQDSPVSLPKFEMAPAINLNVLWVQQRNQIYCPFLTKFPASEYSPDSPMERDSCTQSLS